jgi:hypothetical protein
MATRGGLKFTQGMDSRRIDVVPGADRDDVWRQRLGGATGAKVDKVAVHGGPVEADPCAVTPPVAWGVLP